MNFAADSSGSFGLFNVTQSRHTLPVDDDAGDEQDEEDGVPAEDRGLPEAAPLDRLVVSPWEDNRFVVSPWEALEDDESDDMIWQRVFNKPDPQVATEPATVGQAGRRHRREVHMPIVVTHLLHVAAMRNGFPVAVVCCIFTMASILGLAFETVIALNQTRIQQGFFLGLELTSTLLFSLEWLLRLAAWLKAGRPFWHFFANTFHLCELLGLTPFYLQRILHGYPHAQIVNVLRLFRITHLWRMGQRSERFTMVLQAVSRTLDSLMAYCGAILALMIVYAVGLYEIEGASCILNAAGTQYVYSDGPLTGALCHIQAATDGFWAGIITIETVGYGDLTIVTAGTRVFTGGLILLSILLQTLPVTLVSASMADVYNAKRMEKLAARASATVSTKAITPLGGPREPDGALPPVKSLKDILQVPVKASATSQGSLHQLASPAHGSAPHIHNARSAPEHSSFLDAPKILGAKHFGSMLDLVSQDVLKEQGRQLTKDAARHLSNIIAKLDAELELLRAQSAALNRLKSHLCQLLIQLSRERFIQQAPRKGSQGLNSSQTSAWKPPRSPAA